MKLLISSRLLFEILGFSSKFKWVSELFYRKEFEISSPETDVNAFLLKSSLLSLVLQEIVIARNRPETSEISLLLKLSCLRDAVFSDSELAIILAAWSPH